MRAGRAESSVARRGPERAVRLSVIVPAHKADLLPRSLGALLESDLDRDLWELIVAIDGAPPSWEEEAVAPTALRYADVVVRLPGKPRGPAYARNRGAEVARGDVLLFVDSDVCVHRDTLRRVLEVLDANPDVASLFGSYDDRPEAPDAVSQYRNLLHHYVHQRGSGSAETFWAGLGAIRAEVFQEVGGYDEWHFQTPQIEDIELGRRLRRRGHRILLDPSIQGCHLKRWTLANVLETDLRHRGMPWTRLILHEGPNPSGEALNIQPVHRTCVVLTWLAFLVLPGALVFTSPWPLALAALAILVVIFLNRGLFAKLRQAAGARVALAAVPLHILFYFSNGLSVISGAVAYSFVGAPLPPPDVVAFDEVGVETWPPIPSRPKESVWYEHGV